MPNCRDRMRSAPLVAFALSLALTAGVAAAQSGKPSSAQPSAQSPSYPGIGRTATPKEIAAWDIDVRPDFNGLPKGSGSVALVQDVW